MRNRACFFSLFLVCCAFFRACSCLTDDATAIGGDYVADIYVADTCMDAWMRGCVDGCLARTASGVHSHRCLCLSFFSGCILYIYTHILHAYIIYIYTVHHCIIASLRCIMHRAPSTQRQRDHATCRKKGKRGECEGRGRERARTGTGKSPGPVIKLSSYSAIRLSSCPVTARPVRASVRASVCASVRAWWPRACGPACVCA